MDDDGSRRASGFTGGPEPPPADWIVLLDRIEQEVRQLAENRRVWQELSSRTAVKPGSGQGAISGPETEAGSGAEGSGSGMEDETWIGLLYFRSQALGVRRMVDGDRRAGSFKRLLHKMTEDCRRLTRRWFIEAAGGRQGEPGFSGDGVLGEEAGTLFTRYGDPWGSGHLDSEVPRSDLHTLESCCSSIKRYVDQHVTHAQLDPDAVAPPGEDIDAAIDVLLSLLDKYVLLLRQKVPE